MHTATIEKIRKELDIVEVISSYINLTKKGNNYVSLCPFHSDSNPSLSVSQSKQIFKCFACGHGGDVISFVSDFEKIPFQMAIQKLAKKLGIEIVPNQVVVSYSLKDQEVLNVLKDANDFFMHSLKTEPGQLALEYAEKRGFDSKILEKFQIGYAPIVGLKEYLISKDHNESNVINASLLSGYGKQFFNHRLMFAITNLNGDVVGFSGRIFEQNQEPKYLNSSQGPLFDKSALLYNWFSAKDSITKTGEVFLVEGFMDVIACEKANLQNVIALMGTNLSKKHLELLKNYKVILMFDSDSAGVKATLNAIEILVKNRILVEVVQNQFNIDPDETLKLHGLEKFLEMISNRCSWIEFVFRTLLPLQFETPQIINNFINSFKKYLLLANELEWEFYVNKLSEILNLSRSTIMGLLPAKIQRFEVEKYQFENFQKVLAAEIKPKNYSYVLIRSMLKRPEFIKVFQNSNLSFDDQILITIGKYLINYEKNQNIPVNIKQKFHEILQESQEVVNSVAEFQDYIDRIKWTNVQNANKKIAASLGNIFDPKIAIMLLEEQIKLKRGK